MKSEIESLVTAYDRGDCTRRNFILAVSALLAGCARPTQTKPSGPIVAKGINHVTLQVKDLTKSLDFYQRVFRFSRVEEGDNSYFLGMGSTFLSLDASGHESAIDHFCLGIDGYDPKATKDQLASLSITATIENRNQLYFRDPDGIKVQLSSADYQG